MHFFSISLSIRNIRFAGVVGLGLEVLCILVSWLFSPPKSIVFVLGIFHKRVGGNG